MLLALVCLAGLAPGLATAWLVRSRGHSWALAIAAGVGVTASLPLLLLATVLACPPAAYALTAVAVLAALQAYDDGRIWIGTAWATTAAAAFACAGWWTP
ncbi:hypothetical protein [Streptomyces kebangsaanensis]|uniref:hypothetical protein n=1 Tax=Streptomyces kebangsaanensis TaxID=864058 RepID=UPI00094044C2|nr:hypothetical protein [Streptomyces kebangsaanensis]